jgi:hypothetical protein
LKTLEEARFSKIFENGWKLSPSPPNQVVVHNPPVCASVLKTSSRGFAPRTVTSNTAYYFPHAAADHLDRFNTAMRRKIIAANLHET